MKSSGLSNVRLYEQVVQDIESLISDGQLKPGDKLPSERMLAEQFSVSRTVIREAVQSLQEKGVVEIRSGVGTFIHKNIGHVVRQSLGRIVMIDQEKGHHDLMQVRDILEPEIAAIAAENATEEDIQSLYEAYDRMNESITDIEAFIAADHKFHLMLARATQNDLMFHLIDSIVDSLAQQRQNIFLADVDGPKRGQKHHLRILEAIKNRDSELARRCMIAHLLQVREDSSGSNLI